MEGIVILRTISFWFSVAFYLILSKKDKAALYLLPKPVDPEIGIFSFWVMGSSNRGWEKEEAETHQ